MNAKHLPSIDEWLASAPKWVDDVIIDYNLIRSNFSKSKPHSRETWRQISPSSITGMVTPGFLKKRTVREILSSRYQRIEQNWVTCQSYPLGLTQLARDNPGTNSNLWLIEEANETLNVISGNHRSIMSKVLSHAGVFTTLAVPNFQKRDIDTDALRAYEMLRSDHESVEISSTGIDSPDLIVKFKIPGLFYKKTYTVADVLRKNSAR